MRLSLMKGAHADLSSTAWQEIGVKPFFGLSGIPQHSMQLLLQNGFCQVAWMVHINPVLDRQLVGKQLQRDHLQHGR
jgi:hypothetical protein